MFAARERRFLCRLLLTLISRQEAMTTTDSPAATQPAATNHRVTETSLQPSSPPPPPPRPAAATADDDDDDDGEAGQRSKVTETSVLLPWSAERRLMSTERGAVESLTLTCSVICDVRRGLPASLTATTTS